MRKIIAWVSPVELNQTIYVYENGNKLDMASITQNEFVDTINKFINEYNIEDVLMFGPTQYATGLANRYYDYVLKTYKKDSKINFEYR